MQAWDKYNERVEAVLARSRLVEGFVAVAALATALMIALLPVDLDLQVLALGWITVAALRALARVRPGICVRLDRDGAIEVARQEGRAMPGSFVAPWLVIVRWRLAGAWFDRTLLVAPDMLPAEDFRRLRVLLRAGDAAGTGPATRGRT